MALRLRIYDSSGLLVLDREAGFADVAPTALSLSPDPWDPAKGALVLSHAAWSLAYDGKDGSGAQLRNGVYLLVIESAGGATVRASLRVLGAGSGRVSLVAGPNPVLPQDRQIRISWAPITIVELKVYSLDGSLVRDLGGAAAPPLYWDLRSAAGEPVAGGIFVVSARIPGERQPQTFKLRVVR